MRYVERILDRLGSDAVRAGDPVVDVTRTGLDVIVRTAAGTSDAFDAVVMATHADDALGLLRDADVRERAALAAFEYSTNRVVLHTDTALLPRRPAAWASWNVDAAGLPPTQRCADDDVPHEPAAERCPGRSSTAVSVNPDARLDPDRILADRAMRHPLYTFETLDAQARVRALQGWRRTFYAGAHLGYGFHEDGCRSGIEAAERILAGIVAPMDVTEERAA